MALFHPIAVQSIWPGCCSACCSAFVSLPVQSRSGPCSKASQALHSLYSIILTTGARSGEHAQPNEGNSGRSTMTQRLLRDLASIAGLPTIHELARWPEASALMSYGPDL